MHLLHQKLCIDTRTISNFLPGPHNPKYEHKYIEGLDYGAENVYRCLLFIHSCMRKFNKPEAKSKRKAAARAMTTKTANELIGQDDADNDGAGGSQPKPA